MSGRMEVRETKKNMKEETVNMAGALTDGVHVSAHVYSYLSHSEQSCGFQQTC